MQNENFKLIFTPKDDFIIPDKLTTLFAKFNSEEITESELLTRLKTSDSFLILIEKDSNITGFVTFNIRNTPVSKSPFFEITSIFEETENYTVELLERIIEMIKSCNDTKSQFQIHTNVPIGNGNLFEKNGFVKYQIDGRYVLL